MNPKRYFSVCFYFFCSNFVFFFKCVFSCLFKKVVILFVFSWQVSLSKAIAKLTVVVDKYGFRFSFFSFGILFSPISFYCYSSTLVVITNSSHIRIEFISVVIPLQQKQKVKACLTLKSSNSFIVSHFFAV